jgi:hypothetical protein
MTSVQRSDSQKGSGGSIAFVCRSALQKAVRDCLVSNMGSYLEHLQGERRMYQFVIGLGYVEKRQMPLFGT